MNQKLRPFENDPLYTDMDNRNKVFISTVADKYRLTVQDFRNCLIMQRDFQMWGSPGLSDVWTDPDPAKYTGKQAAAAAIKAVRDVWNRLKNNPTDYSNVPTPQKMTAIKHQLLEDDDPILGSCPVASPRTRCCNLQTLDAVINCGFACSYCSIQTFYHNGNAFFHKNLKQKLNDLEINPDQLYHIGTGQSSDSLMWGNQYGLLEHILAFAKKHSNVILELKSKSSNTGYLEKVRIPFNVISTWTLNTQTIIDHEEHGTASLDERIDAAKRIAKKGNLVGFHFHPIIQYSGWQNDYQQIADRVITEFRPDQVAMVSFGTATFIKPVIKRLRATNLKTKILQMPLEECQGKFTYPFNTKKILFSTLYDFFKMWHGSVFMYLCMEPAELWMPVFGYEYDSNDIFQQAMEKSYMDKIRALQVLQE